MLKHHMRVVLLLGALALANLLVACDLGQQATPVPPTPSPVPVGKVITTDKGQYIAITAAELKAMIKVAHFVKTRNS